MKQFTMTIFSWLLLAGGAIDGAIEEKTLPLPGAHLQATISITPINQVQSDNTVKIQPGTAVKLSAIIKNIGDKVSHSGKVFIRFAFLKPLDGESRSVLFETERESLPLLEPGQEVDIAFSKVHNLPSFFDYVREDWHMRQYEAVVEIQGQSQVIGRAAISISAKYYNGPTHEMPSEVPPDVPSEAPQNATPTNSKLGR